MSAQEQLGSSFGERIILEASSETDNSKNTPAQNRKRIGKTTEGNKVLKGIFSRQSLRGFMRESFFFESVARGF